MGSQQTIQPTYSLIKKPSGYPTIPTPGKLEMLWDTNKTTLWHRFSPYVFYSNGLLGTGLSGPEPFYYVYADENNKGLNALRKYDSQMFPIGSAPIDVIRVAKFLGSGRGIKFMASQFLLQTSNVYNETRIYNPTSPLVAAGMSLGLGTMRPMRHLNLAGGLQGIAQSVLGDLGSAIFGAPKQDPPSGTVGLQALPPLGQNDGKGLLRAGTANKAKSMMEMKWPISAPGNSSSGGFLKAMKGMVTNMFSNFIPQTQSGITRRSDEGAYGRMIASGQRPTTDGPARFGYTGVNGQDFKFLQRWVGGSAEVMRREYEVSEDAGRIFVNETGQSVVTKNSDFPSGNIPDSTLAVGVDLNSPVNVPVKYGNAYGTQADKDSGKGSDVMIQHYKYAQPGAKYPTKVNDLDRVNAINDSLKKSLKNIQDVGGKADQIYTVFVPPEGSALRSGTSPEGGYDRLSKTSQKGQSAMNYPYGTLRNYDQVSMIDNTLTKYPVGYSKKMPTARWFDAINTLEVLDDDRKINNSKLQNWIKWQPYDDDQIAFFFYDVVNKKYIPFRATVKSIVETGNASWEEMPFIGRADKLYSYGGFNRTLSFVFHVHINSISELAPTYQRINYLTTLIKPSNYTKSEHNNVMNRFMVPPMVMLTVGDLYKDQPILIQSVVTTIPDDASWETMNEENAKQGWSYLAGFIKAPQALYGQLPRSLDISLTVALLEKERAIVGGANFGHAPRQNRSYQLWNQDTVPNGGTPNKFHRSLVVSEKNDKMYNSLPEKIKDENSSNSPFMEIR